VSEKIQRLLIAQRVTAAAGDADQVEAFGAIFALGFRDLVLDRTIHEG
jgi:hypothetical protein